jgi:hypothetical protein
MWLLMPVILVIWEPGIERIVVQGQPGQISQITKAKRTGGHMAQVVEQNLPSKCKTLSSNTGTPPPKKNGEQKKLKK